MEDPPPPVSMPRVEFIAGPPPPEPSPEKQNDDHIKIKISNALIKLLLC